MAVLGFCSFKLQPALLKEVMRFQRVCEQQKPDASWHTHCLLSKVHLPL